MMKSLYDWFKARLRASQAVTSESPSHHTPQPWGRPVVGMTEIDYVRLLISTRCWP
jgi:hypothetical protein